MSDTNAHHFDDATRQLIIDGTARRDALRLIADLAALVRKPPRSLGTADEAAYLLAAARMLLVRLDEARDRLTRAAPIYAAAEDVIP